MKIDYASADKVMKVTFDRVSGKGLAFPEKGTLSELVKDTLGDPSKGMPVVPHQKCHLLASASVEMWHRAIHSFLWSVALKDRSELWSSVTGYYSSHFVMRAFAHALGIYRSFTHRTVFQLNFEKGSLVCNSITDRKHGEHQFYWSVVKEYPRFLTDSIFSYNHESGVGKKGFEQSDYLHRNFANYTDHIDHFSELSFPKVPDLSKLIAQISIRRKHSVELPRRARYPDLQAVQTLAYQRIVAYRDFLDERVPRNAFWDAHRDPVWARPLMNKYTLETESIAAPDINGMSA